MKRLFDISFSLIALIVFGIPMIIIALIIKLKEKHSVLFKQERVGLNREPFIIYKLQTLVNEQPTATGKILRRTGIDEIPQFINVLKGDMSIVGPRALTRYDIDRLQWNTRYYSSRWKVKPGISGFAQIYGGQNKKISWFWDKKYAERSNALTDFTVILISFSINLLGKTKVQNIIRPHKKLKSERK